MAAEQSRRSAGQALAVFLQRRSLAMLGLGFASGLPYMLIFDTLSVWLRDAGLSLAVIGFFSLATLSFSFKFLWAPWSTGRGSPCSAACSDSGAPGCWPASW